MEIERKWLLKSLPDKITDYPHESVEQCYISFDEPVIRLRKYGDKYFLTVKGRGRLEREESEFEISRDYYCKMSAKAEGLAIKKERYKIPYLSGNKEYTIELDVFKEKYEGLFYAEVEFASVKEAELFNAPEWFGREVTLEKGYSNAELSQGRGSAS